VYFPQGKKSKRLKQSEKNESISNTKEKGSNPNKDQSPLKNLDVDMQYRSSAELLNTFKIKGKSKLFGHKSVIQSSSGKELSTSHIIAGKGHNRPRYTKNMILIMIYQTKNSKGLDDLEDQEEIGEDECTIDEKVDIDCCTKGISKQKKVRRQTTCKNIHARNLEEREEVAFDKGQAVVPTDKIVSELTSFIRTIARNPRFINLMYTNWHAVPKDIKKRMWEYINSKFLIPVEGKKWVMTGLRNSWRRHKQKMKERFFDKNSTVEDMLAKRPDDTPEVQFRQLIEYCKHPTVQAIPEVNSQNGKQQKWRHRMRPINYPRVCGALYVAKENNEEPS
ncbi:hypothetical protein H5410_061490, partial [Solanum commersonii]